MRRPSDAQARCLAFIELHPREVLWPHRCDDGMGVVPVPHEWRPSRAKLCEIHTAPVEPVIIGGDGPGERLRSVCPEPKILASTLRSVVAAGWLSLSDGEAATLPPSVISGGGRLRDEDVFLRALSLTDDGRIALGLWRQEQAATPAAVMTDRERAVVELAVQARAIGYVIVPETDDARALARAMRRGGWIYRGSVSASARSVDATAIARVEVDPGSADTAETRIR